MARNQKLNVDIEATDKASAKIEKVDQETRSLDGKKADVEISADTSGIDDALDALDGKIGGLGSKFGGLASPAGGVAALAGGLLLAADYGADLAIEADNIASLTGDSVEEASQLNAVWKQTGAETKDLQDVLLQMNGVLATDADLAKELGVNLEDGATVGQRFKQVAAALDQIPDAAKRSQIASRVFGEEGVRQYNALRQSVGDLSTAMENVPAGSVISEEDVENARRAKQQIQELKAEFLALATALGSVVIPGVSGAFNAINGLFKGARKWGETTRAIFTEFSLETENQRIAREFDESNEAAAEFDRTLLKGLRTFDDVHAKVLELTDSQHAANLVAIEWQKSQEASVATTEDLAQATNDSIEPYYAAEVAAAKLADTVERKRTEIFRAGEITADHTVVTEAQTKADERAARQAERNAAILETQRSVTEALADAEERRLDIVNRSLGGAIRAAQAQRDARDSLFQYNEKVKESNEAAPEFKLNQDQMAALVQETALEQLAAAEAAAQYRIQQAEAAGATVTAADENRILVEELGKLASTLTGPVRDAVLQATADLDALAKDRFFTIHGNVVMDVPGRVGDFAAPEVGGQLALAGPATAAPAGAARTINNNFYVQNLAPEKVVDAVRRWDRFNTS